MSEKPTVSELPPEERDNLMDLDTYRQKRIVEGTWPPTREDHFKFFSNWKQSRKK